MNARDIATRLEQLQDLRRQQEERLTAAQLDVRQAIESLARIEGACQDCQFWLAQLGAAERTHAQANGAAAEAVAGTN